MRERNKLTDRTIKALIKGEQWGLHSDGGNLYLNLDENRRSWIFRYRDRSTRRLRDMGIGPLADVTLALAREKATRLRLELLDGMDPLAAKRAERAQSITFRDAAERYIAAHRASWKNAKHAEQWTNTLDAYAKKLMPLPVSAIDTALVIQCLEPEWHAKHETMTRVRQRIEAVLDWATARGLRAGDNPARWKGHLDKMLPAIAKRKRVKHHGAVPYLEMPEFMAALRARSGSSARALEFTILTATRESEAALARWDEIDLEAPAWTIPAGRTKTHKDFRVALSPAAVALLKALPREGQYVFPGLRPGQPVHPGSLLMLLKKMAPKVPVLKAMKDKGQNPTVHGFRSSFRDWAGDRTQFPRELIEEALSHQIKNAAEAAYRRSDAFEKRLKLMRAWAAFCASPPMMGDKVTPITSARQMAAR